MSSFPTERKIYLIDSIGETVELLQQPLILLLQQLGLGRAAKIHILAWKIGTGTVPSILIGLRYRERTESFDPRDGTHQDCRYRYTEKICGFSQCKLRESTDFPM